MGFELFKRRSRPVTDTPVAGVQNRGSVSLNQSAYALLHERLPKGAGGDIYVQWLYDKARALVAMRPVAKNVEDAYIVRKQPKAATYIITGRAFFAYYGLESNTLRRYKVHALDEHLVGFSLETDQIGQPVAQVAGAPERPLNAPEPSTRLSGGEPAPEGAPHVLSLSGHARLVYDTLSRTKEISGDELRQKLGMDPNDLRRAMIVLSTQLQKTTGKSLDTYFQRKRVLRDGQRFKTYRRTKAGEKLIREISVA